MASYRLEGMQQYINAIKRCAKMDAVKEIVKRNGAELDEKAMKHANFRGHWRGKRFVPPTGNLKRSIELSYDDDFRTATVEATAHYAGYVEHGTRKMSAQPYMKPAFEEQEPIFKKDLEDLVGGK